MVEGSLEESDVVFGENIDKIIDSAEMELEFKERIKTPMQEVPEVDVEESMPKFNFSLPKQEDGIILAAEAMDHDLTMSHEAKIDMNNFALLSER